MQSREAELPMAKKNAKQTGKKTAKKPAKKTAKNTAQKPGKKTGKAVGSKPAEKAGESKKRHDAARLTLENLGLHTGDAASEVTVSRRDYSDPEKLQKLYTLGIALQEWANRFEGHSAAAIAAGSVDEASVHQLLTYAKQQVEESAAEAVTSSAVSRADDSPERDLDRVLSSLMQLPVYIEHHFNFQWSPPGPFVDGSDDGAGRMEMEWVPPELPPPPRWFRDAVKGPLAAASTLSALPEFEERVARVARVGVQAVRDLIAHIDSEGKGGFARRRVETFLQSPDTDPTTRRVHEQFVFAVDALADLANRQDASQAEEWVMLTQYLHARYGEWSDRCFAPTVPLVDGRKRHTVRSTRQSKKDLLRRLVATVSQYGTLLQGAVGMPRMAATILSLRKLGRELEMHLRKVHKRLVPPNVREIQRQVRSLDQRAVTASDREHWVRCLGPRVAACGRLAERISRGDVQQVEPWEPKEYLAQLRNTGIFQTARPDDEFIEMRLRMQEAGIAVQAPWKYIEGKRAEPETKKGVADKWLLNPMAQILAPVAD